jgi:glutamine amidotransferase
MSRIGILSYGCGNVTSVNNAVRYCGSVGEFIEGNKELEHFNKIILPGVGAFDHAVSMLDRNNIGERLKNWVSDSSNKLLGICLGMQLLCNTSEESINGFQGLGLIDADVKILKSNVEKRLPNIGWSHVDFHGDDNKEHSGDYYFVHSYGAFCKNKENELGFSMYGDTKFSCAITNGQNIYGYQFHPEKSHKKGLALLMDFCKL